MSEIITIDKNPQLPVSSDYYALRKKAMDFLQTVGTQSWTDFNLHDGGITLLELLNYGITDLSFRQNQNIEDLLTINNDGVIDGDVQALFTPLEILTTNCWTIKDYRKLLIDLEGVRNAWLFVKEGYTGDEGQQLFIDCKNSALVFTPTHHSLDYKGLYDVHVELEDSNLYGDLNSGNIVHHFVFQYNETITHPDNSTSSEDHTSNAFIEVRLSSWEALSQQPLLNVFKDPGVQVTKISGSANPADSTPIIISGNHADNVDIQTGANFDQAFRNALRRPLYATFYVHHTGIGQPVKMEDVPIVLYFYERAGRMNITLQQIKDAVTDSSASGIMQRYLQKLQYIANVMGRVFFTVNEYRNLSEEFVKITTAETEDFAICCDVEAETDTDLELLQAEVYYAVFAYMNPPINFYSWKELMAEGQTVDQIFNGPQTSNGFIKDEELNNSELRTWLYTSDLINAIMDIPGIKAIRNFSIVRMAPDGSRKEAQPWQMKVSNRKLPRFYLLGSKINFYKNGLPFVTDVFELNETLGLVKAKNEKPKLNKHDVDIDLPKGNFLNLGDYYPLMYSLPQVYNLSEAGPMPPLTEARLAQTKQIKAYMMLYEQKYANWINQIDQLKNFFNANVDSDSPTYQRRFITNNDLPDVQQIYETGYDAAFLTAIAESKKELYDRRNRIYNHLLSRLGENNNDYLLFNNRLDGSLVTPKSVLDNKAELIKGYAFDSRNKARALNYHFDYGFFSGSINMGMLNKLSALLGLQSSMDVLRWQSVQNNALGNYQLVADYGNGTALLFNIWQTLQLPPPAFVTENYIAEIAYTFNLFYNNLSGVTFDIDVVTGGFQIVCYAPGQNPPAHGEELFRLATVFSMTDVTGSPPDIVGFINGKLNALRNQLNEFTVRNVIIPIEHILLRPQNLGDSLLNICVPNNCEFCGDEDPYSFRMTILLCGDDGFLGNNLTYRAYAETTIRKEVPAHIMIKICWLSKYDLGYMLGAYEKFLATSRLANGPTDMDLADARNQLVDKLNNMRSMYPEATLHDCVDGNDDNRVFLGKTVIRKSPNLNI